GAGGQALEEKPGHCRKASRTRGVSPARVVWRNRAAGARPTPPVKMRAWRQPFPGSLGQGKIGEGGRPWLQYTFQRSARQPEPCPVRSRRMFRCRTRSVVLSLLCLSGVVVLPGGAWGQQPYGKGIVQGSADESVRLWDTATARQVRRFGGHSQMVRKVAFLPGGKVASVDGGGAVRQWEIAT